MSVTFPILLDGSSTEVNATPNNLITRSGKGAAITPVEYDDGIAVIREGLNWLHDNMSGGGSGVDGKDGNTILAGIVSPLPGDGVDGDFFIELYQGAPYMFYGPKANGAWPAGTIVVGQDGNDGKGISSILRTSGDGSPGTIDTYTITFTDTSTSSFTIYNGSDGTGGGGITVVFSWLSVNTTLESNKSYFLDTTQTGITHTLPATPTTNDWIEFSDAGGMADINPVTIDGNGNVVMDSTGFNMDIPKAAFRLVYSGASSGWVIA